MFVNETTMTAYYGDEANGEKMWNPMGAKVEMLPPRMAAVLLAPVPFLLDQPRLTDE